MKKITVEDVEKRCLSCGEWHVYSHGYACCDEYNKDDCESYVSVSRLREVLKDFQMEMCREHCVIRGLLKEAFEGILKEEDEVKHG